MRLGKHKRRLYLLLVSDGIIRTEDLSLGLSNREKRVICKRVEQIRESYSLIASRHPKSYNNAFEYLVHRLLILDFGIPKQVFITLADRAGVSVDGKV